MCPAPNLTQNIQPQPLQLVGGNKFGRFPKISQEQTWNFIVSDDFLVPYAGYKFKVGVSESVSVGRGLYVSSVEDFMLAVINAQVYRITSAIQPTINSPVGALATSRGIVYMAENNARQILITDGLYTYVYDYGDNTFYSSAPGATNSLTTWVSAGFVASGYCSFQDGRFIVAINGTQTWALSGFNDGLDWSTSPSRIGTIQSKPGYIQAALPMPGGGNNLLVFGSDVAESWQDVGAAIFPYQRNSTFNIDYGCLNAASIAELENFVVWLAVNEQSGPVIMYTQGSGVKTISTDGINFKLTDLSAPQDCLAFLFKQDGHLIYQITFYTDNLSYAYDFNTGLFFTVSDENLNYHPAARVVFFNNKYYFVSLNDSGIYEFGTQFTDAVYSDGVSHIIPRIRVIPPLRLASQRYFICKSLGFTIENGLPNLATITYSQSGHDGDELATEDLDILVTEDLNILTTEADAIPSVEHISYDMTAELSISRDGAESFGNSFTLNMNPVGKRKSRFIYQRLGIVNDATFQLRFSGRSRFVVTNGECEVYQ